jgi:SAM-dependent methyltransferase
LTSSNPSGYSTAGQLRLYANVSSNKLNFNNLEFKQFNMSNILKCPTCGSDLKNELMTFQCNHCKHTIPATEDGVPIFLENFKGNEVKSHNAKKSSLKSIIKKLLYPPHHSMYSDLASSHSEPKELLHLLKKAPTNAIILNIGSLSKNLQSLHKGIRNLDICHYPNIDFIADVCDLPFQDCTIDMIIFKNVLEHVKNPQKALNEISRVLKKDGILYVKIPFLQPFHAVPDDFQRYTTSGFRELFKNYHEVDSGVAVGGGSMVSWIIREYLAILTSFGNSRLYRLGLHFWGWLTFWIKYSDLLLRKNKFSGHIASAFYGIYKKK